MEMLVLNGITRGGFITMMSAAMTLSSVISYVGIADHETSMFEAGLIGLFFLVLNTFWALSGLQTNRLVIDQDQQSQSIRFISCLRTSKVPLSDVLGIKVNGSEVSFETRTSGTLEDLLSSSKKNIALSAGDLSQMIQFFHLRRVTIQGTG